MLTNGDLPRDELLELALKTSNEYYERGVEVTIHFKFTCAKCGERCTLVEPNVLRENGECFKCGAVTPITEGGFMLIAAVTPRKEEPMK